MILLFCIVFYLYDMVILIYLNEFEEVLYELIIF